VRTVAATRYVTPLREGGSLPALVEADDEGLYVVKLRGAGQGDAALTAELLVGELARVAGLPVPEIVLVDLDPAFGKAEPDPEIRELLEKSAGLNLGLDYLPGAAGFDPLAKPSPLPDLASRVVLFDAFAMNVDRTPKNPNILSWHRALWLIDHGAALYFQHGWRPVDPLPLVDSAFAEVRDHVLLEWASQLATAETWLAGVPVTGRSASTARPSRAGSRRAASRCPQSERRRNVPARSTFDYAIVRVVPRVERQEFVNAGVIVSCQQKKILAARIELDEARLLALDPSVDLEEVRRHLATIPLVCEGGPEAGAMATMSERERWHWLIAPRSTIVQTSPAHVALADDAGELVERLLESMVRRPKIT
jgi:hypothetical protein